MSTNPVPSSEPVSPMRRFLQARHLRAETKPFPTLTPELISHLNIPIIDGLIDIVNGYDFTLIVGEQTVLGDPLSPDKEICVVAAKSGSVLFNRVFYRKMDPQSENATGNKVTHLLWDGNRLVPLRFNKKDGVIFIRQASTIRESRIRDAGKEINFYPWDNENHQRAQEQLKKGEPYLISHTHRGRKVKFVDFYKGCFLNESDNLTLAFNNGKLRQVLNSEKGDLLTLQEVTLRG